MLNETLSNILSMYDFQENILWQIEPRHRLCLEVDGGTAYMESEDGSGIILDENFLGRFMEKAQNIYSKFNIQNDILVIFEDHYNADLTERLDFIKSCLINNTLCENSDINWSFVQDENQDEPIDNSIHTCKRHIFDAKSIDTVKLFKELAILSKDTNFDSAIYIVEQNSMKIFCIYDDLTVDLIANSKNELPKIG